MRRTPTCALHVHVGMPDPESAIRAFNGLRAYLPVLQGLAAHSPYWHGLDSGFASARAQLFRAFPRAVIPPAFAGWEDYEAYVGRRGWRPATRPTTRSCGGTSARTRGWAPSSCGRWTRRRAWARSPAWRRSCTGSRSPLLDGRADPPAARAGDRRELVPRRPRRARRDAALGRRDAPAAGARRRGDRPGRARALRERGGDGALEEAERILREGNGADRMRAAHAAGGMRAVLERLVAEAAQAV